jgi:hypothetical protein
MIATNCILVDGLPGSGKSTTAHLLCRHLKQHGIAANWIFEHDTSHPVYDHSRIANYLITGEFPSSSFEKAPDNWRQLCATLAGTADVTILESSFFQTPVHALRLNGSSTEDIAAFAMQCAAAIAPLHPQLVHLRQSDTQMAVNRACAYRGEWFAPFLEQAVDRSGWARGRELKGQTEVLAYFDDYIQTVEKLIQLLPFPTLSIDISDGNHERINQQVCQFLDVPGMDTVMSNVNAPDRFIGCYRASQSGEEFIVFFEDGLLKARGPSPGVLLPLTDSVFEIRGINVKIKFIEPDENGICTMACFEGNLSGLEYEWRRDSDRLA